MQLARSRIVIGAKAGLLEAAVRSSDLEEVRKIASVTKAVGHQFGIPRIEELGVELDSAAARGDLDALDAYVALYRDYVQRLRIEVEPE